MDNPCLAVKGTLAARKSRQPNDASRERVAESNRRWWQVAGAASRLGDYVLQDTTLARRDEVKEILRSLSEALRHPAFATALATVLSGKGEGGKDDYAGRPASDASAENGEG